MLAALIAVGPIALAARGGNAASESAHPAVAMTVTQIAPAPAPLATAPIELVSTVAPKVAAPVAARTQHASRSLRVEEPVRVEPAPHAIAPVILAPVQLAVPAPPIEIAREPAPAVHPSGPTMIRPDEVRRLTGEIERIDGRRIDRDGGPKRLSAVLCIDARGTVSSVKLLAPTPAWLGEALVRDLRAFTFTPYRGGAACFVRQLSVD
jgi:hypothetical protein